MTSDLHGFLDQSAAIYTNGLILGVQLNELGYLKTKQYKHV